MLNYDDLLQQKLDQLERGEPLEDVLKDLPEEAADLASLIRLASAVSAVPHPEPLAETVSLQRKQLLASAEEITRPVPQRQTLPTLPARPSMQPRNQPRQQPRHLPKQWNPLAWLSGPAMLGAAGAAVVLMIIAVIGLSAWLSGRGMDTARVEQITGQVQVANGSGTEWKNIDAGYRLKRGDQIRTLGASTAALRFYEDTYTYVAPNTTLAFTQLNGSSGRAIQVELTQQGGETWHKVTPLQGEKSFFLVRTPSGTASVHGTQFAVKVGESGQSQFLVDTGEVRVNNNAAEVTLLAGQTTTAALSGTIEEPAFQFTVQGAVLSVETRVDGSEWWEVSGVAFVVDEFTSIAPGLGYGSMVRVSGRIMEDGTYLADSIQPAVENVQTASFTGTLEAMDGANWTIGGASVLVSDGSDGNAATALAPNLTVGDPVRVTFNTLPDGTWLALAIESLVEDEAQPDPTATADPNAMPSYEFDPDELVEQACEASSYSVTGSLRNTSDDSKDYAANVDLGYLIDQGGEYVSTVEIVPSSWSRIEAGQTVNFTVHVNMNDNWASVEDGAEVKLRVYVRSATNRPDHLNGRLTVTIVAGCEKTPTATSEPTITDAPTNTPEGTITAVPLPTALPTTPPVESGQCTGADPHPTGLNLSQRYGVPYETIMYWFCEGRYGFGEIDLAYSLSRESGRPVEEIFAMRASGMGWGEIKKAVQGEDGGNGNDKDKDKDKDNKDKNKNKKKP